MSLLHLIFGRPDDALELRMRIARLAKKSVSLSIRVGDLVRELQAARGEIAARKEEHDRSVQMLTEHRLRHLDLGRVHMSAARDLMVLDLHYILGLPVAQAMSQASDRLSAVPVDPTSGVDLGELGKVTLAHQAHVKVEVERVTAERKKREAEMIEAAHRLWALPIIGCGCERCAAAAEALRTQQPPVAAKGPPS